MFDLKELKHANTITLISSPPRPDALARINRVPEGFMLTRTKGRIEDAARKRNATLITLEITEEGIAEGIKMMEEMLRQQAEEGKK